MVLINIEHHLVVSKGITTPRFVSGLLYESDI